MFEFKKRAQPEVEFLHPDGTPVEPARPDAAAIAAIDAQLREASKTPAAERSPELFAYMDRLLDARLGSPSAQAAPVIPGRS
jgi:hypothetical protein